MAEILLLDPVVELLIVSHLGLVASEEVSRCDVSFERCGGKRKYHNKRRLDFHASLDTLIQANGHLIGT
jgi:hypothetical protein